MGFEFESGNSSGVTWLMTMTVYINNSRVWTYGPYSYEQWQTFDFMNGQILKNAVNVRIDFDFNLGGSADSGYWDVLIAYQPLNTNLENSPN